MSTLLLKRGLEANRLSFTPAQGELIYTTDTKKLYIGDGTTAGGIELTGDILSQAETDARYLQLTGGTLTGDLVLPSTPTTDANGAVTKSYVDGLVNTSLKSPDGFATVGGGVYPSDYKGTGTVSEGDTFYVTSVANGTDLNGGVKVNVGDMLVALSDNPGNNHTNWTILESNRDVATKSTAGIVRMATDAEASAGTVTDAAVSPKQLGDGLATKLDVTLSSTNSGDVITYNGTEWTNTSLPSSSFASLTDTPADYSGSAGKFVVVNAAGTGLEYADTIDGGTF